jgi:hypothetical protein
MLALRNTEYSLFGWALLGLISFCMCQAGVCRGQSPRGGTLHIDGTGIERLVLRDSQGQSRVCPHPTGDLVLPEGDYRVYEVTLQGGHSCRQAQLPPDLQSVRIRPRTPATLKLGAPLRQQVQVSRHGAVLALSYCLIGQGGESYAVARGQGTQPPGFGIYQGQRKIASGHFRPG